MHLQDEITDDNVADIAEQTSAAVASADDLSTVHVDLAADIVSNISATTNISEAVREISLKTYFGYFEQILVNLSGFFYISAAINNY